MHLVVIIAAAVVAWVAGALWYMLLAGRWHRVAGVQVENRGRPSKASPMPYLVSGAAMLVVAATMDWIFQRGGIDTLLAGALTGFAIGAFIVAPWTLINRNYVNRPAMLTVIDGAYAVIALTLIGAVLGVTG